VAGGGGEVSGHCGDCKHFTTKELPYGLIEGECEYNPGWVVYDDDLCPRFEPRKEAGK
jgi:hypothetical protein